MAGLWQGIGEAVSDIRQKLVEEPMWGRAVTDRDSAPEWPQAQEPEQAFGSSTQSREMQPDREQAQDLDIDR